MTRCRESKKKAKKMTHMGVMGQKKENNTIHRKKITWGKRKWHNSKKMTTGKENDENVNAELNDAIQSMKWNRKKMKCDRLHKTIDTKEKDSKEK